MCTGGICFSDIAMPTRSRGPLIDEGSNQKKKTRYSYDFTDYHYVRKTNIYFECPNCTFSVELQNWLFHRTMRKWCLHFDKFHKCPAATTLRCSQRVLPPHAKGWPTMSNDTAKRLLQSGHILKLVDAPSPFPDILPLQIPKKIGDEFEDKEHFKTRGTVESSAAKKTRPEPSKRSNDALELWSTSSVQSQAFDTNMNIPSGMKSKNFAIGKSGFVGQNADSNDCRNETFLFDDSMSNKLVNIQNNPTRLYADELSSLDVNFEKPGSSSGEQVGLKDMINPSNADLGQKDQSFLEKSQQALTEKEKQEADDAHFDSLLDQLDFSPFEGT